MPVWSTSYWVRKRTPLVYGPEIHNYWEDRCATPRAVRHEGFGDHSPLKLLVGKDGRSGQVILVEGAVEYGA